MRVGVDLRCRNTNMWYVEECCGCFEVVVGSGRPAITTSWMLEVRACVEGHGKHHIVVSTDVANDVAGSSGLKRRLVGRS